jgi:hypothetical protein
VTEVGVTGSGGDDQVVIRNITVRGFDFSSGDIESGNLRHENFNILVGRENRANRRGDFPGGKPGSGDLIEKRLEGVVILAVYHGDLGVRAAQRLGGIEAAEACSNDYHARQLAAVDRFVVDLAVRFHTV